MRARTIACVLVCALLLAGCVGCRLGSTNVQEVTLAMGFVPNVQFAPVYVAIEKGYFAQEGLRVKLDYGMETDLLQRVGMGELAFAVASGDQVVLARGNGLPVRYVLNWYRRFPVCVVSLAGEGITTPQQLAGKTVGIPVLFGASYIGWQAFEAETGLAKGSVKLQTIGYTQVASLVEGRVDAAVCYAMNEPVQLRQAGYQVNTLYLDRYIKLVSNGLITNDETIEKRPKLVQGVVNALLRGLRDTINDPDAAFAISRKQIPEMDDTTAKLQRAVLQEAISFWQADDLGANQPEDWQESVSFLRQVGLLAQDLQPTTLYTDQFVRKR